MNKMREELIAWWAAFYGHNYNEPFSTCAQRAIEKVDKITEDGMLNYQYSVLFPKEKS